MGVSQLFSNCRIIAALGIMKGAIMRSLSIVLATTLAAMAIVSAGPAVAQKPSKQLQRLLALTPADFQRTATLKDDSLDTVAQISTEPGFQEKRGLLKIVWNDNFLRAFIDKKTGATVFQVYQYISYQGSWHFYTTANFETPSGPESIPVTVINRNVNSCSAYLGCSFTEHIGFEVPENLLRSVAAQYAAKPDMIWRFKFGSQAGGDWQDGMVAAEVVGLLAAVDQYRATHRLSPTVEPTHTVVAGLVPTTPAGPPAQATELPKPTPAPAPTKKRSPITCMTCN
jgi:hypothetical protein